MTFTTRFAPSPTGPLHLGHAYSAILAHDMARAADGRFLIRIEDIDRQRSRQEWEAQIFDDLAWLGLDWDKPVMRQSDRQGAYDQALATLADQGLTFPCSCSRADIEAAASAPQEGQASHGPDGRIYPGTCRDRPLSDQRPGDALRLNLGAAADRLDNVGFDETGPAHLGQHRIDAATLTRTTGDVVLARRDWGTSYHLSVVVDDAAQGITHVIRGEDLFEATQIHAALQTLLGLPTPLYHHHRLIRDDQGKRLAKRDDARAIATFRADGATPEDIRKMVGL